MLPQKKSEGQILLEKTPAYFFDQDIEKRIHAAMPNVKLILIVRDPVTRMISEYVHARIHKPSLSKSFKVMPWRNDSILVSCIWNRYPAQCKQRCTVVPYLVIIDHRR